MEPLNDQDPISKLLAQARPVEPRGNFTQNVLREARQTPQDRGWLSGVLALFSGSASTPPVFRLAAAAAAAAVVALIAFAWVQQGTDETPTVAVTAPAPEVATPAVVASVPVATSSEETLFADEIPLLPEVETQWQNLDHQDALLAVEDTSMLSDSEVAFFLY